MIEEKIAVQISGQTYEIVGNPADALHYNYLAQYVEEKIREIERGSKINNTQKIAVLAALRIAEELFQEREKKSDSVQSLDKKHDELIRILAGALEGQSETEHRHSAQDAFVSVSEGPGTV